MSCNVTKHCHLEPLDGDHLCLIIVPGTLWVCSDVCRFAVLSSAPQGRAMGTRALPIHCSCCIDRPSANCCALACVDAWRDVDHATVQRRRSVCRLRSTAVFKLWRSKGQLLGARVESVESWQEQTLLSRKYMNLVRPASCSLTMRFHSWAPRETFAC